MRLLLIAILLIAAAMPVYSQDSCYCGFDFVGNVRNTEGRRISNAVVILSGCADLACTEWRTTYTRSNTFGYFTFRDVLPIDYVIEIEAKQYQPFAELIHLYDIDANAIFTLLRPGQSLKNAAARINSDTPREPSRSFFPLIRMYSGIHDVHFPDLSQTFHKFAGNF